MLNFAGFAVSLPVGPRMHETDRTLVDKLLRRDAQAFEILYDRYERQVFACVLGYVRDSAAAEDLVQEVFLRLWNRADQWEGSGALLGWLLRIGTNLALNHRRTVKRRRERPIEIPPDVMDEDDDAAQATPGWMVDAASLGPDALVELSEQRRLLSRFVDGLSEEKREVIRLVHDAEMEMREVADRLGVPEGTVKSRLYHARRRLAEQWREIEQEGSDDT